MLNKILNTVFFGVLFCLFCKVTFAEEENNANSGALATETGKIILELIPNSEEIFLLENENQTGSQIIQEEKEEESSSGTIILETQPNSSGNTILLNTGAEILNNSGNTANQTQSGSNLETNSPTTSTIQNPEKKLFINEAVINPQEGKEWIEIYNSTSENFELTGFHLDDAVKIRHTFTQENIISAKGFITIEFYNIFNNSGDCIYLKNNQNLILDQICYGEEDDLFTTINKGESLGRSPNGSQNLVLYDSTETTKNSSNLAYYDFEIPKISILPNIHSGSVLLNWEKPENTVNFKHYQIYQNIAGSGFVLLSEFTENTFQIQNLAQDKIYAYLLKACDFEGNCTNPQMSKKIIITDFFQFYLNEFVANAVGNDTNQEWIELHYAGSGSLILEDLYLEIDAKKRIDLSTFPKMHSGTGAYLTLNPQDFGITLKNSNSSLKLKKTAFDFAIDEIEYVQNHEGKSWRKNFETRVWEENYHPTPNSPNILHNQKPQANITIQGKGLISGKGSLSVNVTAENSSDADGDTFTCFWDYGDGFTSDKCNPPSHKYSVGEFDLKLIITDVLGEQAEAKQHISVQIKSGGGNTNTESFPDFAQFKGNFSDKIKINEILPNPKGKDKEGEWVELINLSNDFINLDWWQIDDEEGGSKPYKIPINTVIQPKKFLVLKIQKTGIGFKNSADQVRLLAPNGKVKDTVIYSQAKEAKSYQRQIDNSWYWLEPTQNQINANPEKEKEKETPEELKIEKDLPTEEIEKQTATKQIFDFSLITLNEFLPNSSLGDKENEWIEIYNQGQETFNLTGWSLDDEIEKGSKPYFFPENTLIKPQSYLIVHSKESKIALNNSQDTVNLINSNGEIQESFHYQKSKKDHSWSKNRKKRFLLSAFSTKGKANILTPLKIKNDTDQDGISDQDELQFYKTNPQKKDSNQDGIPDGFEIYNGLNPLEKEINKTLYLNYLQSLTQVSLEQKNKNIILQGTAEPNALVKIFIHSRLIVGAVQADEEGKWSYPISQKLASGKHHVETEIITKTGVILPKQTLFEFNLQENYSPKQDSTKIKIHSILPNSKGKDQLGEYFSLVNHDQKAVNLQNWQIINQKNQKFIFPETWLQPQESKKFFYTNTKISLNNTQGFLILFNSQNRRTDFLSYADVQEGEIFTHTGGNILNQSIKKKKQQKVQKTKPKTYDNSIEIQGLILSDLNSENFSFWLKNEQNEEIKIQFQAEKYPLFIAKILFAKGNQILLTGNFTQANVFMLEDFILLKQISSLPQIQTKQIFLFNNLFWILCLLCLGSVNLVLAKTKKFFLKVVN